MAKTRISVSGACIQEGGEFTPTEFTADGIPVCYGNYLSGRRCNCEWSVSCAYYTYDEIGQRSRNIRFQDYETVPLVENMDFIADETGNERTIRVNLPGAEQIDLSEINLHVIKIMVWMALENPAAAKALMLKLDPQIKCLQDIACVLGVSKQAVQRRVAAELGIGKRHFKEASLMQLNPRELKIFQLYFRTNHTLREVSAKMNVSCEAIRKIATKLRRLGFSKDTTVDQDNEN